MASEVKQKPPACSCSYGLFLPNDIPKKIYRIRICNFIIPSNVKSVNAYMLSKGLFSLTKLGSLHSGHFEDGKHYLYISAKRFLKLDEIQQIESLFRSKGVRTWGGTLPKAVSFSFKTSPLEKRPLRSEKAPWK